MGLSPEARAILRQRLDFNTALLLRVLESEPLTVPTLAPPQPSFSIETLLKAELRVPIQVPSRDLCFRPKSFIGALKNKDYQFSFAAL